MALVASPAAAEYYHSRENPLTAREDGTAQAQMYGHFLIERPGPYLRNNTHLRDPRPGGDAVFEQTLYSYWYGGQWNPGGKDESAEHNGDNWYDQADHDAVPGNASRGYIHQGL